MRHPAAPGGTGTRSGLQKIGGDGGDLRFAQADSELLQPQRQLVQPRGPRGRGEDESGAKSVAALCRFALEELPGAVALPPDKLGKARAAGGAAKLLI